MRLSDKIIVGEEKKLENAQNFNYFLFRKILNNQEK